MHSEPGKRSRTADLGVSPRERVLRAVTRRNPGLVPKEAGFTPPVQAEFELRTGCADPQDYFGMETRHVDIGRMPSSGDFTPYLGPLPQGSTVSIYGIGERPAGFHHFTGFIYPLLHTNSLTELESYPWPEFTQAAHHDLETRVRDLHQRDFFVKGFAGHIFETAWEMTGYEHFFEWVTLTPELSDYVLDRITEDNVFKAKRFVEAGVDMLQVGDDVATQRSMMMNPDLWRRILKPRLAKVIKAGRDVNQDIPVLYHSDGVIGPIIGDLVEVGVTVLNPVQPECIDLLWLKKEFGDQLSFWGTIGTQTVMPFGTPEEVEDTVRTMIELFAPGLVIAPTHVLEPDVPWDNITAMFAAVEKHGGLA